jgi:hypothetical protein
MSLGVGIFASVVLVLAVYHKGFRKVVLCTVALALLAVACYFGYDRYSAWHADRETQKQKAAIEKGVTACMLRLGTPMPTTGTTTDGRNTGGADDMTIEDSFVNFANLTACRAYPDLDMAARMGPGFEGGSLPPGYMLDLKGRVAPIPPGATNGSARNVEPIDSSPKFVPRPKKETHVGLEATITCDLIVYDRDKFASGDPEAIASMHTGESVQYIGHVTVGDQEIIRIHGRKGYVSGCVDVKQ